VAHSPHFKRNFLKGEAAVNDVAAIDKKLNAVFPGRVVRKDLTKRIKEGANVPVYVLEYLLGNYCASDDPTAIEEGVQTVKGILANNYVRPDEAEKIKSRIKEQRYYKIIDRVTVTLSADAKYYVAELMNMGLKNVGINESDVLKHERLLSGGIWCILGMEHRDSKTAPFVIDTITPIQMPHVDTQEIIQGRQYFTTTEWIDVLLRSTGIEPNNITPEARLHLIARMIPLIENNYNSCELGPRSTGKSHVYKEISPNSILVSGGQTTVANLFYNMSRNQIGLVGLWDVVAFDEVAGITFKDKDGVQIMKDYMASGSFARGKAQINANASLVFVGNVNQSIEYLVRTSHLFAPFPEAMIDTAFLDRFHTYIPGWEVPKFGPRDFTDNYGFIVDYMSEWVRELRKQSFADAIEKHFRLGNNLKQRDVQAVRKTVSGMLKLLFPDGKFSKDDLEMVLTYAIRGRRRVKEQLKKLGGMEFYDVNLNYIDLDTNTEKFVALPEQGGNKLITDGPLPPGQVHFVSRGETDMVGLYRIEIQTPQGTGKVIRLGRAAQTEYRDQINTAFMYFKTNANKIDSSREPTTVDYMIDIIDYQGAGVPDQLSFALLTAIISSFTGRYVNADTVLIGGMSIGGSVVAAEALPNLLQVAYDHGANKVYFPALNVKDLAGAPEVLSEKLEMAFYRDPVAGGMKIVGFK
jgi:ATP-dependent Lon protease